VSRVLQKGRGRGGLGRHGGRAARGAGGCSVWLLLVRSLLLLAVREEERKEKRERKKRERAKKKRKEKMENLLNLEILGEKNRR
jgi:hypothetical protein